VEWQQVIADCGLAKHMTIAGYLKSEHGMGHGYVNALVGWTLAGNVSRPLRCADSAGCAGADVQPGGLPGSRMEGAAAVRGVPSPWVAPMAATERVMGWSTERT
jgi:hypothetical protein